MLGGFSPHTCLESQERLKNECKRFKHTLASPEFFGKVSNSLFKTGPHLGLKAFFALAASIMWIPHCPHGLVKTSQKS